MSAPTLDPTPPTPADILVGRANLLGEIARYIAFHDLALTTLRITSSRVEYQTNDHPSAVAVALAFGAVAQDDRRSHVQNGKAWAMEHWASDVLRVSWCKRLETAA